MSRQKANQNIHPLICHLSYTGAAASIMDKDYLTAAASILSVEARHASYIRSELGESPFPNPFDTPLDFNQGRLNTTLWHCCRHHLIPMNYSIQSCVAVHYRRQQPGQTSFHGLPEIDAVSLTSFEMTGSILTYLQPMHGSLRVTHTTNHS